VTMPKTNCYHCKIPILMKPTISVVISTHNRSRLLLLCLQGLVRQTINSAAYEIIVVDNHSTDDTKPAVADFIHKHPKFHIKYIYESKIGLSIARNQGASHAVGKYLAFIDDDAQASPEWLKAASLIVSDQKPDVFGGPIYPQFASPPPNWFKPAYETRTHGPHQKILNHTEYLSGSNIFIKKSLFINIGGFNPRLGMSGSTRKFGEETFFQQLARSRGHKVFYSPNLKITHHTPQFKTTLKYIFATHFQQGIDRSDQEHLIWWKHYPHAILAICQILILSTFGLALRDRHQYPYYQQFLHDKIAPLFFWIGRIWHF